MKYQLRWWYVLIISTLVSSLMFLYHLNPQYERLKQLNRNILSQQIKLSALRNTKKLRAKTKTMTRMSQPNEQFFLDLFNLARADNLSFHSISYIPKVKDDALSLYLVLIGSYSQFARFVANMSNNHYPMTLLNFDSTRANHNQFQFTMTISMIKRIVKPMEKLRDDQAATITEPFCLSDDPFEHPLNHPHDLTTFALSQFKMTGYFQHGNNKVALLASPNNKINEVSVGTLVGNEYAEVIFIDKNKVYLSVKEGKQQIIRMQ